MENNEIKIVKYDDKLLLKSNLSKQLYQKLRNINDEYYWVMGIIEELFDDDKKLKKMIDIVDSGEYDIDKLGILSEEINEGLI